MDDVPLRYCAIWLGESVGGAEGRTFSSFLTWLQEKKVPVFVIATANSIENLPPFFQAEDGIRDPPTVSAFLLNRSSDLEWRTPRCGFCRQDRHVGVPQIGRASCRERV